jgi:hypothetical protein
VYSAILVQTHASSPLVVEAMPDAIHASSTWQAALLFTLRTWRNGSMPVSLFLLTNEYVKEGYFVPAKESCQMHLGTRETGQTSRQHSADHLGKFAPES